MPFTKRQILNIRLRSMARAIRVFGLHLAYGWTTPEQRYESFFDGQLAVESAHHHPANRHQHPVLREAFESGAYCTRDDFKQEAEERWCHCMAETYAALQRDEMAEIREECFGLGLVTDAGVVRES